MTSTLTALRGRGGHRYGIVVLLAAAVTVNYVDRSVIGILKPLLERELGWDQVDYGITVSVFQAAYAIGYPLGGWWVDRVGVRTGLLSAVIIWSLAAMGHAFVHTIGGFSVARAILGLAEGACFPASIKAVAERFPPQHRAFATGVFNSGSSAGTILCPLIVPWVAMILGWQGAFLVTGALGLIWVPLWLAFYTPPAHPHSPTPSSAAKPKIRWLSLFRHRQTWAFAIGMASTSPVWWFYIFWIPDFLNKRFHLNLVQSSGPLIVIFLISSLGGVLGGAMPSMLMKRRWSVNAARKIALLVCACAVLPVFATPLVSSVTWSVALVSLAAAAHCGYAANLYTLVGDTVPQSAVASVVGIGGIAGSVTGIIFAQVVARLLQATHDSYVIPFGLVASVYLVALLFIHLLLPRLEMLSLRDAT